MLLIDINQWFLSVLLINPHGIFDMPFLHPCQPGPVRWLESSPVYLGQLLVSGCDIYIYMHALPRYLQ